MVSIGWAQTPRPASDPLTGLWGTEQTFGPLARGELTIDGRRGEWRAHISGFDVAVTHEKEITFSLGDGGGNFRGHLAANSKSIIGQWIQPTNQIPFPMDCCDVGYQPYTTPVELEAIAPRVWRGRVIPLDDYISLYVLIKRGEHGELTAIVRNPEFGWGHRKPFAITEKDGGMTFSNGRQSFEGKYDSENDHLVLQFVNNAPPLFLTRRKDNAIGFFPRTPRRSEYEPHTPIAEGDGWAVGALKDAGLDSRPIAELVQKILNAPPEDTAFDIQSLLIARHGKLVLEEYFYGFSPERSHDTRSAGKTFASMLVGLARDHGGKVSPTTPVYSLFPEYKPFANWDERKQRITVEDLMSMTAGYDCDEDHSETAPLNEDLMQDQKAQPDWYKFTLDAPMAHDPGGKQAYYCSPEPNLVGGVAAKSAGESVADLFYEDYARPLQFHTYHLNLQPTGEAYMGGGAYIRPRDQLKLGQLYLNGGTWNGRRVISKAWVAQSLAVRAKFQDQWFGVDHFYGWGWHILRLNVGGHSYTEYESGGNGGQFVLILPELDMVVGFTGGAYGNFRAWGPWATELMAQYIIPAAVDPRKSK
jgi:CubicO group peptidase (beta-lactamase class C family)